MLFGERIHAGAGSKIGSVLAATMEHDDQRHGAMLAARNEQAVVQCMLAVLMQAVTEAAARNAVGGRAGPGPGHR